MNAFKTGTNTAYHYLHGKEPSGFTLSGTHSAGIREMETGVLAYNRLLRCSRHNISIFCCGETSLLIWGNPVHLMYKKEP
jgi:hypothetical protein